MNTNQMSTITNSHPTKERDYDTLPSQKLLENAIKTLTENNFIAHLVKTKEEALAKVKDLIPEGVSVMNGTSATLHEIGYVDFLKSGKHKWNNLHEAILAESDPQKQGVLRKQSVISDYYVGSVHALSSETGELVIASNSGSQLPHLVFTSPNLVLVIGAQKIMPTLNDAIKRLEEHVVALENKRMREAYGFGTTHSKTVILHKETPMFGRNIHVILVEEKLGF